MQKLLRWFIVKTVAFSPPQAPNPCHSQHEDDNAGMVRTPLSSELNVIVSLETTISSQVAIDDAAIVSIVSI